MSMTLRERLAMDEVIKEGHFKLTSGRHSRVYINKDDIYSNESLFRTVVNMMCTAIVLDYGYFDIITGPAIAGAVLAAPISLNLGKPFVYPEKKMELSRESYMCHGEPHFYNNIVSTGMEFRRGYDKKLKGKRVVIVEDIITTGKSVNQTIDAIKECGGTVDKIFAIWNRTGAFFSPPTDGDVISLINEYVESWDEKECELCKEGIPLTDPKTGEVIK